METSKDIDKQPPAVKEKPLADSELDKVSGGDQLKDLEPQIRKELERMKG
jgi:hypothetical protein